MAITRVVEKYTGLSGDFEPDGHAEMVQLWTVVTTGSSNNLAAVRDARGIPRHGDALKSKGRTVRGSQCYKVLPRQLEGGVWEVTCNFEIVGLRWPSRNLKGKEPKYTQLIEKPVQVVWGTAHYLEYRLKDLDGKLRVNGAGDPFDPPTPIPVSRTTAAITHWVPVFDRAKTKYADKVNSDPWFGYKKGEVLCKDVVASPVYDNGEWVQQVTYRIEIKEDLWIPTLVLNAGPRYYEMQAGVKVKILAADDMGVTHNGQVLLTEDGFKQPETAQIHEWVKFRDYDWATFKNMIDMKE